MTIERLGSHGVQPQVDRADQVAETRGSGAEAVRHERRTDEVAISSAAKELAEAQQAVAAAPDVREDRVAALQQAIDTGAYEVPVDELAKKLLGRPGNG